MSAAVPPDHEPAPPLALVTARAAVARGWRPFPVEYGGKRPAVGIRWGTATAAPPPDKTLELWFGRDPVNVGIACKPSELYVLDEDTPGELDRLAADRGAEVPDTYTVHTAKGRQLYFAVRYEPGNEHLLRNRADIGGYDIDARGAGEQNGGYVVAAGSRHATGVEYLAQDSAAEAVALPEWVTEWLREVDQAAEPEPLGDDSAPVTPSRSERSFTAEQAVAYVERYGVAPLRAATEGGRNTALNTAAITAGHFVPAFWTADEAADGLAGIARDVGLDEQEIGPTIRSGLTAGMREPYGLADPFGSASGSSPPETDDEIYARELAAEVRRERLRRDARELLARERRADAPDIAGEVLDDLDAIEPPEMLLGSLIPEDAIGFIGGRSGAYKTFLATSWACSIATGRPWLGRPAFAVRRPLRTLYVAAEGAAGAAARIRAWESANGCSRRGRLLLYPKPVRLTDPDAATALIDYVAAHDIGFVVIDTLHRSMPGTEENSSSDFATVFAAIAPLRDEHGCGVLLVDHTGHAGERLRGTSSKGDDADYVLIVSYEGQDRSASVQRELRVDKLKDWDSSERWPIRLAPVDGHDVPVVVVGELNAAESPLGADHRWWLDEVPGDVAGLVRRAANKGRGVRAALDVVRILRAVDDEAGLTKAELEKIARDRGLAYAASEWREGVALVKRAGIAVDGRTPEKFVIAVQWAPKTGE